MKNRSRNRKVNDESADQQSQNEQQQPKVDMAGVRAKIHHTARGLVEKHIEAEGFDKPEQDPEIAARADLLIVQRAFNMSLALHNMCEGISVTKPAPAPEANPETLN